MGKKEFRQGNQSTPPASAGCMSGVLHFLNFHHLLFTGAGGGAARKTSPATRRREKPTGDHLRGIEAPRNSLERTEETVSSSSFAAVKAEYFDVPIGIQVERASASARLTEIREKAAFLPPPEERRSSESTPRSMAMTNVVAKLMGLDVLPEQQSPSPVFYSPACPSPPTPAIVAAAAYRRNVVADNRSREFRMEKPKSASPPPASSNRHPLQSRCCNTQLASRSLPDTPRASAASSASGGRQFVVDVGPRLSLQINKENVNPKESPATKKPFPCFPSPSPATATVMKAPAATSWNHHFQEEQSNYSRNQYAREIVKQVKEYVGGRRDGMLIDQLAAAGNWSNGAIKSRRTRPSPPPPPEKKVSPNKTNKLHSASRSPPRSTNTFMEAIDASSTIDEEGRRPSSKPPQPPESTKLCIKPPLLPQPPEIHAVTAPEAAVLKNKMKKSGYDRFTEKIAKPSPPRSTAQSPAASSLLLQPLPPIQIKRVTKETIFNTIQQPKIQTSRSGGAEEIKMINETGAFEKRGRRGGAAEQLLELRYVKSILERAGIAGDAVSRTIKWHSPSHPLDPIIFHQLELKFAGAAINADEHHRRRMRHRWNRKLMFQLVDEILVDLIDPGESRRSFAGEDDLLRRLWERIRSFPAADCKFVGDIDALVEGDLREQAGSLRPAAAEVAERLEREIFESLVGDAATEIMTLLQNLIKKPCFEI